MASNQAATSIVTQLASFFNKKKAPETIRYQDVNAQDEQTRAIQGDRLAQQSIESLLSEANRYTQEEANSLAEMASPGYSRVSQKMLDLAGSNLENPYALPDDVANNLTRLAGERGISTGVHGQANDFSLLRDFGINSLDYGNNRIAQSQQLLNTVVSLSPRISPLSPMNFYITPQQQISLAVDNNTKQQQINQAGANAQAATKNWNTQQFWASQTASAAAADSTAQYGYEQFKDWFTMGMMGG